MNTAPTTHRISRAIAGACIVGALVTSLGACADATADPAPSASATDAGSSAEQSVQTNEQLVTDFYNRFFTDHDISAAEVIADDYIQHNPSVPNGKQPFVDYFTGYFAQNPQARNSIVRSAAQGDLVFLHVHSTNGAGDRGQAIVDIFRVADGKIVEHWDVIQDVPATAANNNTMF